MISGLLCIFYEIIFNNCLKSNLNMSKYQPIQKKFLVVWERQKAISLYILIIGSPRKKKTICL